MDHASLFSDARNGRILAYFKGNSVYDPETETYRLNARPDLTGELHDVIAESEIPATGVSTDSIYGWPVVIRQNGILFAWTGGTYDVFLRLKKKWAELLVWMAQE